MAIAPTTTCGLTDMLTYIRSLTGQEVKVGISNDFIRQTWTIASGKYRISHSFLQHELMAAGTHDIYDCMFECIVDEFERAVQRDGVVELKADFMSQTIPNVQESGIMWLNFCEGMHLIGTGWGFPITILGLVFIVTQYQKWSKTEEIKLIDKLSDDIIIEKDNENE